MKKAAGFMSARISRDAFELILAEDEQKCGHGRVFVSLDAGQEQKFRKDIEDNRIDAHYSSWGMPVIKILDLDETNYFFLRPDKKP